MRAHLVALLRRQRAGLEQHLGADDELADVVDGRRVPEHREPVWPPVEQPCDGLGEGRDARSMTFRLVALFEAADESQPACPTSIPRTAGGFL